MDDSDMLLVSHRKEVSKYAAEHDKEVKERESSHKEIFGNDIFEDKTLSPVNQRLDVSPKTLFSPSRNENGSATATLDSIKTRLRLDRTSDQRERPNAPFASFREECLHLREENVLLKRRNVQLSNLLRRFVTS